MADGVERETKVRDVALLLADDLREQVNKVSKLIRQREYARAHSMSADLQRTARDVKWLMRRLPKD